MPRKIKRIAKLGDALRGAIISAEALFPSKRQGAKKKRFVIDFINDKIDIPLLNEDQEEVIIGLLIDVLVGQIKSRI